MTEPSVARPTVLVTGASRRVGIASAIARALADDGWDVATTFWRPYDGRMPWGDRHDDADALVAALRRRGAASVGIEADLSRPDTPARVVAEAREALGPVRALVIGHTEDVVAGLFDTTVGDFDRAMAVNARAAWLLIRAFAEQFEDPNGTGRIVALTSDHTAGNLAYGASKGALDRIVIAAATELADRGITANVVDPGPTDTGWIDPPLAERIAADTLLGRAGRPEDCAHLVRFLCSPDGGWVNGQLLHSDGGRR